MVGNGAGGEADALGEVLAAERLRLDELEDVQPPLVGDGLQPVAEVLGIVAVLPDEFAQLMVADAQNEVDRAPGDRPR